jgi:hypothetical protein
VTLNKRPSQQFKRGGDGPPAWFVFIVAVAVVFGAYYVWLGLQNFLRAGGVGVVESTERAKIITTATAELLRPTRNPTQPATFTPIPPCQDFRVIVPSAIVRETPNLRAPIVTTFLQNQIVCVIERASPDSEWYLIDSDPESRRIDTGYMNETVIRALKPTLTPSRTPSPLPTVTVTQSPTATQTLPPQPTETRNPAVTDTPIPTLTPSNTPPRQSA